LEEPQHFVFSVTNWLTLSEEHYCVQRKCDVSWYVSEVRSSKQGEEHSQTVFENEVLIKM